MTFFGRKSRKIRNVTDSDEILNATPHERDALPHYYDQFPQSEGLTFSDYAAGAPNIRLTELVGSFARQLKWVVPLFLIGTAGAWFMTKDFKRTYQGDGRLLVQLGEEYVYSPIAGSAGSGLMQTPDTITLNEVGILNSDEVIDQVIGEMTSDDAAKRAFHREAFDKMRNARTERERQDAYVELRKFVQQNFLVMPQPKSSIIDVAFRHENPTVAVEMVNALINAYLSERRTIFVEGSGEIISERRIATEEQLDKNERAIARFLKNNNVSDFTSEQTGLRDRTEKLKAELNQQRAQITETETALAAVEDILRRTDQTINLYVDDRVAQRVSQAELELQQLLAKYLPTSDPVRQKQTELAELRSLQRSQNGQASGGRRVGPNPVYQELVTRRNTLKASADSYREKEYTLQQQLNSADQKIRRLTSLTPSYMNLLRERDTLSTRLKTYNSKEQEALVNASQAEADSENIRVISYAKYASRGRNTRLIMFVLASMGWGFTLFMLALLKVFLDPKLYAHPASATRSRRFSDDAPNVDFGHIPEPVAPYTPSDLPPGFVPAAAEFAAAPTYQDVTAQPQEYAEPVVGPTEWSPQPATAQMDGEISASNYTPGQYRSDGAAAYDVNANPYLGNTAAVDQTYNAAPPIFGPPPK